MASSQVMASTSSANSDLTRQSSLFSLALAELQSSVSDDHAKILGSMNTNDMFRNIYGENPAAEFPPASGDITSGSRGVGGMSLPRHGGFLPSMDKKVIDVDGSAYKTAGHVGMTLEDFLARAIGEEDIRDASGEVPQQVDSSILRHGMDSVMDDRFAQQQQQQPQLQPQTHMVGSFMGPVNVIEGAIPGGGMGKRRALEETVQKIAQQRQKRMIKNRESAAKSRERKHAHTVELESFVTALEEDNASLVRQLEEQRMKRLNQLMENLIPVVERKRPPSPRRHRRTRSMEW